MGVLMADTLSLLSCDDPKIGEKFVESLRNFGFAALINHPLDGHRIQRIYDDWRLFLASGEAHAFAMDPINQDGYFSIKHAEHAKGYTQRDFKEYFQYYPWGRCPEQLRGDLQAYYEQAVTFAATLLGYVEDGCPDNVRARFSESLQGMITDSQQSMLRVLHYPPVPIGQSVLRAAPHEDINLLTLLPAADGPGLEICRRDGTWLPVPNESHQVLINVGDMLQEASGGWLPSTTHRVASHSETALANGRMSLPLFLHPRPDVRLSDRYTAASYLDERLVELGVV